MKTTLRKIKSYYPCYSDRQWDQLVKKYGNDAPITPMMVLKEVGIKDAVWALRAFDYLDYCLFLADVVESILPLFEIRYPDNKAPRIAMENIRKYKNGESTKEELEKAAADAAAAADAVTDAAAYATAYAVVYAAAYAAYAAVAADARNVKWKEIEQLFIKYFED